MATQHDQMMKELITTFPDQFLRLAAPDVAERVHLGEVAFEPEEHYPRLPAAEFLARPEPLAWAFAALMRRDKGQSRPELGVTCFQRIIAAQRLSHRRRSLLCQCVMAYTARNRNEAREFDKILNQVEDEEVRTMTTSVLEMWQLRGLEEGRRKGLQEGLQEGRQEGLQEGRQEGRQEGQRQGEAAILLRQLTRRFGKLSPSVEERLRSADADLLLEWGDRFVTATTVDEIFDGKRD
ncbi:MAG: DUF4351 domain-containing protein [bacterium]|nr:DUF4351 domain-containing protein [bacterium]